MSSILRWCSRVIAVAAVVICPGWANPAQAQNWDADARVAGLSGIGGTENVFVDSVQQQRGDRSLVVPLGLIQLLMDREVLTPRSRDFDPVHAIQYAANPVHFVFGRSRSTAGTRFISGVRNSELQPDLNAYRGFLPADVSAGGLIAPKWGHTFALQSRDNQQIQGLYIGAGPHLTMQTALALDPRFRTFLAADTATYAPSQQFSLNNESRGQAAIAATAGYRLRLPFGAGTRSGAMYVAANASFLRGLRFEDIDLQLRLDTDSRGLLSSGSPSARPLSFTRQSSSGGYGQAVDLGAGVTFGAFEVGVSASNIANSISWNNVRQREYSLNSLSSGAGGFAVSAPTPIGTRRIEVPLTVRGNAGFRSQQWSAFAEVAQDWNRILARGGVETVGRYLELRGGTTYFEGQWLPSAGVSLPVARRMWIDMAAFSTAVNIEHRREVALAVSLRFKGSARATGNPAPAQVP